MRLSPRTLLVFLVLAGSVEAFDDWPTQFKVGDKVEWLASQYPEKWVPARVAEVKSSYWNLVVSTPGGPQNTRDEYLRRAGSTRHYGESEKAAAAAVPAPQTAGAARTPMSAPPEMPVGGASVIGRWDLSMGGVFTESRRTRTEKVYEWGNPEANGLLVIDANGTFTSQAFGRVTKGAWTGTPEKLVLKGFEQDNWTATVNKEGVLKLKSDLGLWQDGHRR